MEDGLNRRRLRKIVRPQSPVVMLSFREIAHRYGFHENTVRRWVSQDGLKHINYGPGNKIYIAETDVEQFLKLFYDY